MDSFSVGFLLKKMVGMFAMPVPVTLLLLVVALVLFRRKPRLARLSVLAAFVVLFVSSWGPVADRLMMAVETDSPVFEVSQPVDAVVVLGSGNIGGPEHSPASMRLGESAHYRLLEGLRILRANPEASLLMSGYAGIKGGTPHAVLMGSVATMLGIDPARIELYPQALDTEGEARLMEPALSGKRFALVTDASHMPRAIRFFRQQGLDPIPAPAVFYGEANPDWHPDARALKKTERALYETLGRIWQWLKGGDTDSISR